MNKILIVGDVMLDQYWFGQVNRISPEAPVPILRVTKQENRLGGAANVARNCQELASELNLDISLLGITGHDEAGKTISNMLSDVKIHDLLQKCSEQPTIIKLRAIGQQQQMLRIDFEEAPNHKVLELKQQVFINYLENNVTNGNPKVIIFSDYAKGALKNISELIQISKTYSQLQSQKIVQKTWLLVDPKGNDFYKYKGVDILTPNRSELQAVVGHWNNEAHLIEKVQNLKQELNLPYLLLTRSEEGMTLFGDEENPQGIHFSTIAKEVFDVSGAGDTVISTLASCLASGIDLVKSVEIANVAGGIVVGKLGTSVIKYSELKNLIPSL